MKRLVFAFIAVSVFAGCNRGMEQQPYRRPLTGSPLFQNGSASRPLVPDTVAREDPAVLGTAETGMERGRLVPEIPVPITTALLARGREQYGIYCAVCHGEGGDGDGIIVQRGFPPPPSFHSDRLRQAPAGHFFDVITHGYGVMYPYADRVDPADRWAITAYVRALQVGRHTPAAALPPELHPQPEAMPASGGIAP